MIDPEIHILYFSRAMKKRFIIISIVSLTFSRNKILFPLVNPDTMLYSTSNSINNFNDKCFLIQNRVIN